MKDVDKALRQFMFTLFVSAAMTYVFTVFFKTSFTVMFFWVFIGLLLGTALAQGRKKL